MDKPIIEIINEYLDGDTEPLDGDDVDKLTHIFKTKVNRLSGNITDAEYEEQMNKLYDDTVVKQTAIITQAREHLEQLLDDANLDVNSQVGAEIEYTISVLSSNSIGGLWSNNELGQK